MNKIFDVTILPNLLESALAFFIVFSITALLYLVFRKKYNSDKEKIKFKSRLIYVSICVFAFLLIQVWIDGLTPLFTMLGLVGAGLVITNKESIMNFIGFLIINWRSLFTEGDFIQIQNYTGYIYRIGLFYFKIYETTSLSNKQATGRKIKFPNSLIITTPIITFSPDINLCLSELCLGIKWKTDLQKTLEIVKNTIDQIIITYYENNKTYNFCYIKKFSQDFSKLINLEADVYVKLSRDKKELLIYVNFYAYPKDLNSIENQFWIQLQKQITSNNIEILV